MFQATTMIAVLLPYLGVLYSPCQVHHKFFSNPFNSTWIIALFILISPGVLFLQMCQMHHWCFRGGLVSLEFLQGEETGSSQLLENCWLSGLSGSLGSSMESFCSTSHGQPLGNQSKSLPAGLPSGRPPLLLGA